MALNALFQMTAPPGIVGGIISTCLRRLMNFLFQSAFPKSESNLFEWAGTIEGAVDTVNEF
jgi:hypothetical protein